MTPRPVEAVWCWRLTASVFKATYGRLPGTTYSKDFLQPIGACARALEEAFRKQSGDRIDFQWVWPGGARDGLLFEAADYADNGRLDFRWETNNAPDPWKLYPAGDPSPLKTFIGDPTHTNTSDADKEFAAIEARGEEPWLVIVKLQGEDRVLHARAYLTTPPPSLQHTSTSLLPQAVRDTMATTPSNRACGVYTPSSSYVTRASTLIEQILNALSRSPNVLLVGPPGTGKTVALEDLRAMFETPNHEQVLFDPDETHDCWSTVIPDVPTGPVRSLVFHPSYSYEEFVVGLIPVPSEAGIAIQARPGPLLSLAHWASEPGNAALLILDEFNRGNAAAIFGDVLALLDKEKRVDTLTGQEGAVIDRAYPDMALKVPSELGTPTGGDELDIQLRLPASLWIVAALNSADRSVAPLDAALRRRFSILPVGPDYEVLASHFGIAWPEGASIPEDPESWEPAHALALAVALLEGLNERIELVLGADFLLGHALVWDVGGPDTATITESLAAAFDERIASTLRMTFADQDDSLAAVLGVGPPSSAGAMPEQIAIATWVMPSEAVALVAPPRLRLTSLKELDWQEAGRVLRDLV